MHTYREPRPIAAADSVIFGRDADGLNVLLIERGHDPYQGHWAIPGGFVNDNEPLDDAAARELEEETGLIGLDLQQVRAFGDPGRDPRGWAISIVYTAVIDRDAQELQAGDDAAKAQWFPLDNLPPLAFDHAHIVAYAHSWLRERNAL